MNYKSTPITKADIEEILSLLKTVAEKHGWTPFEITPLSFQVIPGIRTNPLMGIKYFLNDENVMSLSYVQVGAEDRYKTQKYLISILNTE